MKENIQSLMVSLKGLAGARIALLGLEAKEAAIIGGTAAVLFAVALFFLLPAYLLLCGLVVVLLIQLTPMHPALVLGGMSAVHFAGIIFLVYLGFRALKQPMFKVSGEELEKDIEWIQSIRTSEKMP